MRITLVIPTFKQGGMERVMSELADYWSNNSMHIDLVFLVKHKPFYEVNENLNSVSTPNFTYKKNLISKFLYKIKLLFYLRNKYKNLKTDVVLSFGEGYNSFVLLSGLGTRVNVFVSNRSNPFKELSLSLRIFQKMLYPTAKGIFVQTSLAKEIMLKKIQHKNIILMPNPVKIIHRVDAVKRNIVLNVGRLVPEKDQLTLIRIFDEINRKDWELHIIGDGPLRSQLENEIRTRKLEENVKLLGIKRDLSVYMSKSKVFAFTSISEGYPNALCEAMAFPLACISFDCDAGPRDIIEDGENGFLIDKNNDELYKKRLLELMDSDELQNNFMSKSINIRNDQTIERISEEILSALKS
ncbi:glycosyltransferase [uncultured Aquimarina sp.]|uniref:glycosyltransferase n=1 Tax=uncultured Aquimarina sp. TaxID=575652 RepID=UPI00263103F6|nr:glycosyltransferase [uncultured Aquimarina sp.]